MEYRVVKKKVSALLTRNLMKAVEDFEREVNEQLKSGWEPAGGVAVGSAGSGNAYLFQAIIKRR